MGKFLDFEKAKDYVNKLGLKSSREWHKWCKDSRPDFIPCSPHQVYKLEWTSYMDWLGYSKVTYKRKKYSINEDFFETWSHDMAYILGFWWADGCIYDGLFSITQSLNDRYLLEDIAKVMNFDGPIKEYKGRYGSLNIYCRNLVESVKKLGGTENKSLICRFPDVPKEFLPDFIRGLWDGDGSIYIGKTCVESTLVSGSEKMAKEVLMALKENIYGFSGNLRVSKNKYYLVRVSKNNSILLRGYMYSTDSKLYLRRKKHKFSKLGEVRFIKNGFMDFEDARVYTHSLNLKSKSHWESYWKKNERPVNFPSDPSRTYGGSGWINWKDFLGYKNERKKGELL